MPVQMATELELHVIKCLHLKQAIAPPEVTGQRRRLAKGFHCDGNGDQECLLACPAFKEWDVMKAMQEKCHSMWDAVWKGICHAHIKHVLHKVRGDRHGERVNGIEDSHSHLSSDKPGDCQGVSKTGSVHDIWVPVELQRIYKGSLKGNRSLLNA